MLLTATVALLAIPATAQDAVPGFDGFIQSGTCAAPTSDLQVDLESEEDFDVMPYIAKVDGTDDTVALGYYGAPSAPGFAFATIFTDERFSIVIVDPATGDQVACGDVLEPANEDLDQVGLALVRLDPVAGSSVRGFASVERQPLEREVDTITTRVGILITNDVSIPAEGTPAATPVT